MKTTKNLTHETKGNDRIYILWDNVIGDNGIVDSTNEVNDYANNILANSDFQPMEHDQSVASYYGYDNCLICGINEQ